jgi:hypothetical protein
MAGAICGAKVSEAQCFRGIATETWRVAAHGQWAGGGRKLAAGALSGRIWRELQKGAWTAGRRRAKLGRCRWASGRAGQEAGGIGQAAFGFTELGRFIAMSAYRGGMPTAGFTGMLDPAAAPMIFAGWAARFVAAR